MRKLIIAASLAASLAVPALASANPTTNFVARQFSTTIHNRASLSGITVTGTSVKCAADGGGYYSCWATYTILSRGRHVKYGEYLNVTPTRWYATSGGHVVSVW